jgi:Transmembrane secretion effector
VTTRRGGLLRQRNFRLLWVGETVSQAGSSMANVVIPLLAVTVLRASTFDVASLSAAGSLPWLMIGLPAGAWADRLPTRTLMIACDVAAAVLYASLPAAAWFGLLTIGQLVVVALLAGVSNVFFGTAYQVYLPSLVAAGDLVEGNAKLQGSASAATIGGRSAAGVAVAGLGAATAVLFNAASFLASAACLVRIGRGSARPAEPERKTTLREEIATGARFVARDPYLRPLTIYAAVANLAYAGYASLVVLFLVRVAGLGAATVGVLMAAGGIGGTAGALIARRVGRVLGTARALMLTTATNTFGLLIPLAHAGPRVICYAVGAVVMTAGLLIGNIIVAAFRQSYCPPGMLGRVVTGMRFLAFGASPVGALLAGGLGTALGVRNALWCALGVAALSGALLFRPAFLSHRDLPSESDGAPSSNPKWPDRPYVPLRPQSRPREPHVNHLTGESRLAAAAVRARDDLQQMTVRVGKVDSAAAVVMVDLRRAAPARIGPVSGPLSLDPTEDHVEVVVGDQEGIVLGRDLAAGLAVVKGYAVARFDDEERAVPDRLR